MGSQVYEPEPRGVYAPQAFCAATWHFPAEFLMIRGIVLAAGASTRMGQAKAALPLGQTGETVVVRVVRTLLAAAFPSVIVVAGAHIDAVRIGDAVARAAGARDRASGLAAGTVVVVVGGARGDRRSAARSGGRHARRRAAGAAVNGRRGDRGVAPHRARRSSGPPTTARAGANVTVTR